MRLLRPLVPALSLLLLGVAAPAHAAEGSLTGIARDTAGKPLPNVGWEIHIKKGSSWETMPFGPKLTDAQGRFSWRVPVGGTYKVCFYDTYADQADTPSGFWQPEVRHRDTCWPNATSLGAAQPWTSTAAAHSRTFTVTLPRQGLGMAPVAPFVVGTYEVGKPLTIVGQEGWRPTDATFRYQWMAQAPGTAAAPIPGATSATFTPTAAHANRWLWASVTASRAGYKPMTMITPSTMAGTPRPQPTTPLRITGKAAPGHTLTATFTKPSSTYTQVEWFVDGVPQPRHTSYSTPDPVATSRFPVTSAQAGARVEARMRMYATDAQGNYVDGSDSFHRVQVTVAGTRPAQPLPAPAAPSGQAGVGKVLLAPAGVSADPNASVRYQWLRAARPIPGATARRYTVRATDLSQPITVRVTLTRPGWWGSYVTTSKATVVKRTLKVGRVTVTGAPRTGNKLVVRTSGWGPKKVRIRHQWLRDGKAVKGATSPRYRVRKADRGHALKVRVTVSKKRHLTVVRTSKPVRVRR